MRPGDGLSLSLPKFPRKRWKFPDKSHLRPFSFAEFEGAPIYHVHIRDRGVSRRKEEWERKTASQHDQKDNNQTTILRSSNNPVRTDGRWWWWWCVRGQKIGNYNNFMAYPPRKPRCVKCINEGRKGTANSAAKRWQKHVYGICTPGTAWRNGVARGDAEMPQRAQYFLLLFDFVAQLRGTLPSDWFSLFLSRPAGWGQTMKFGFHFCSTALAFWIFVGHKTHNSGLVVCVAVVLRAWVFFFFVSSMFDSLSFGRRRNGFLQDGAENLPTTSTQKTSPGALFLRKREKREKIHQQQHTRWDRCLSYL